MNYAESRAGFRLQARYRAPWRDLVRELAKDVRGRAFALPIASGSWQTTTTSSYSASRTEIADTCPGLERLPAIRQKAG